MSAPASQAAGPTASNNSSTSDVASCSSQPPQQCPPSPASGPRKAPSQSPQLQPATNPSLPPAAVGQKRPSDASTPPASKKPKVGIRQISAEAFGMRGKRPTMEDAHAVHVDLHAVVHQTIVPLEGGGNSHRHLVADLNSRIDANLLGGLNRKAAVQFARLLAVIRDRHFAKDGARPPPPRMAWLGVYDGHCGRRAADFCKKWLHLYIYFALWKLHLDAVDAAEATASTSAGGGGGGGTEPAAAPHAAPQHHLFHYPRKEIEKVLIEACQKMDEAFLEDAEPNHWNDGCTALCCVIIDNDLFCLSVGDSQGVIAVQKGEGMVHGMISGVPHKPTDKKEAKRIKDSKGLVSDGRVLGVLGVSRSIGDHKFKKVGVVPTPNIMKIDLSAAYFVMLACDGLWDVYPAATVTQIVHDKLQAGDDVKSVVQFVTKEAITGRNSHDNVSVVLASFT